MCVLLSLGPALVTHVHNICLLVSCGCCHVGWIESADLYDLQIVVLSNIEIWYGTDNCGYGSWCLLAHSL